MPYIQFFAIHMLNPSIRNFRYTLCMMAIMTFSLHAQDFASEVNPFIGTTNYGTTSPGAVMPNGMMSVVPFNVMGSDLNRYDKDNRWWSAPYEYTNTYFTGFAHVSLSGVGCPEAASLLVMPTMGKFTPDHRQYGSTYSEEKASPGYYSNRLTRYDIKCETTTTLRSSCERYTFPKGEGHILLNLGEGLTNESGAWVRRVSDTEIEGQKLLGTFCYTRDAVFPLYFVMRVSRKPSSSGCWKREPEMMGVEKAWRGTEEFKTYDETVNELGGDHIGYRFTYANLKENDTIIVRMGVSFVSCKNARMNLDSEQGESSFATLHSLARQKWNSDLGRIQIEGGTKDKRTIFYTALYHSLIHPSTFSDVNGEYRTMGSRKVAKTDRTRYSVFSLWDTYRNLHQLLTLVYPERQTDMLHSIVGMYEESGWLPRWELYGRETYTMAGDPASIVIADSWLRGLHDIDVETALEGMLKSANTPGIENPLRPDITPYMERGFIPLNYLPTDLSGDNSVSHTLEYCQADYAISQLAKALRKDSISNEFDKRSKYYRNYYCKESGVLRPRTKDGSFLSDFDASVGKHFENVPGFHEGSAYAYTFAATHDVEGLMKLMGGRKHYINKLKVIFEEGNYDPANEPDIAYPYLFSRFKGEEWRTQKIVNHLLDSCYHNAPNGLPGNDDAGTLSAWALFSMMGLYPDTPAEPTFTLTTPQFKHISITTPSGIITLTTDKNPEEAPLIESVMLDTKKLQTLRVNHHDLLRFKHLDFKLKYEK